MAWAAVLAAAALAVPGPAAYAHTGDPNVFARIDSVTPALSGVTIEIRSGVADQLLVVNTTSTPVEVLDGSGRAFLRIGKTEVRANYASPDWYTSNSPLGLAQAPPQTKRDDWRVVSRTGSWGWFDHRLHDRARPLTPQLKAARSTVRLADWTIPLRYDTTDVTVKGHVEYRPVLGAFRSRVDRLPPDLTADVLDGRVPGLFVRWKGKGSALVTGIDGELFAFLTPQGARVNTASTTYREDQRLRGRPVPAGPADGTAVRLRDAGTSPSLTWLDRRLAYAPGVPPDDVLRAGRETTLVEWRIPVSVGTKHYAIEGTTVWQPAVTSDEPKPVWPYAAAVLAVVAGLVLLRRRVTRR